MFSFEYLQYIISSKISRELILINTGCLLLSGGTALKTGMSLPWKWLHGLGNTFRYHCLWRQTTNADLTSVVCTRSRNNALLLRMKGYLKWTEVKWKIVLWSDESKCQILFGKHGHHVPRLKWKGIIQLVISTLIVH